MPAYVVSSEAPIKVRQIEKPDLPDWPGGPEVQLPRPGLPEDWRERVRDYIQEKLEGPPPPEEWPPLPPFRSPAWACRFRRTRSIRWCRAIRTHLTSDLRRRAAQSQATYGGGLLR